MSRSVSNDSGKPAQIAGKKRKPVVKNLPKFSWHENQVPEGGGTRGQKSSGRVTIADVARHVGVDNSAVSLALRGDTRISLATRNRIRDAATLLGYVPNDVAKSLRGGRSGIIGIMLTDLTNEYFSGPLEEFQSLAEPNNFSLSVKFSSWDLEREQRGIYHFCEGRVEGIICAPCQSRSAAFADTLKRTAMAQIPMVVLGYQVDGCNCVGVSTESIITLGLKHLLELGHRNIGVASATHVHGWRAALQTYRLQNIQRLAQNLGLTISQQNVFDSSDNAYGGVEMAAEIARRPADQRPTAIFATDDMIGRALVAGLSAVNVRVPDEISVLGMDNAPGDVEAALPLTTVSLEASETGRAAMQLLMQLIQQRGQNMAYQAITLSPRLVIRQTCGLRRSE